MTKLLAAVMAAAAIIGASGITTASAGPAWEFTTPGDSFTNGTWDFAVAFTPTANVTASGLGYYADPTTGLANGNQVALYSCDNPTCSSTGTLLATATVNNTYALNGHFRYVTITPITLLAGQSYEVAGVSSGNNYTWNDPGFGTDNDITIIRDPSDDSMDRYTATASPIFQPNYWGGDIGSEDGFWGPNVYLGAATGFTAAPEPASMGPVRRRRCRARHCSPPPPLIQNPFAADTAASSGAPLCV